MLGLMGAVAVLAGLVAAPEASGRSLTETERAQLCAEGEARYNELFGRMPKDEPVRIVLMYKDVFCPLHITVTQGETVRWVNIDKRTSHSVWFKDAGKPESDRLFGQEKVEMTFDFPPGDYPYLCGPHWEREGMVGRVTVKGK
jgi:plastocyanin